LTSRLLNGNQGAVDDRVRGIFDHRVARRETGEHFDAVAEVAAESDILDVNAAVILHQRHLSALRGRAQCWQE